jgi:hypothetical protein
MVLKFEFGLDFNQINLLLISFGVIGAVGTEFWRRRHRYYITNLRIVTECMGKRRSLIGAGVGKSVKDKLLGVMFGGGKTISPPRARSPYILYGIPNPKREYKRITGLMLGLPEVSVTESEDLDNEERCGFWRKFLNKLSHINKCNYEHYITRSGFAHAPAAGKHRVSAQGKRMGSETDTPVL